MRESVIAPLDVPKLREAFATSRPFPWIHVERFLEPEFAAEAAAAMPTFEESRAQGGRAFEFVNEVGKVQLCDAAQFPDPIRRLNEALASPEFMAHLEAITQIPNLLPDPLLAGGGIHVTGPQGRLDVHVDFNIIEERALHRRLNILIYLNPVWERHWGGAIELWDRQVRNRAVAIPPELNHCLLFETSEISYHGVEPVTCPPGVERKSFAAYYYTKEPPPGWTGKSHTTMFRARPDEVLKGAVLMPLERTQRALRSRYYGARRRLKRLLTDR